MGDPKINPSAVIFTQWRNKLILCVISTPDRGPDVMLLNYFVVFCGL